MIIVRTSNRISIWGGSSDYLQWLDIGGSGLVLGGSIDKYSFINIRQLPPFFDFKTKLSYSEIEEVKNNKDIKHKVIHAVVNHYAPNDGLEITHFSDLPSKCGMGSSSTFLVCLLHGITTLKNKDLSKLELAKEAIRFEQEVLYDHCGLQDSVWAAIGGFACIRFQSGGSFNVEPLGSERFIRELEKCLLLMYTGADRRASEIAATYINNFKEKKSYQYKIMEIAEKALEHVQNENIEPLGTLLHESWLAKRSLSEQVSSPEVDKIYEKAKNNGCLGGKLVGAGQAGMMLFLVPPERQQQFKEKFADKVFIPFKFEINNGSKVILNNA